MLYFISTPIGNLEDISYRAISTLNKVDTVICEDTRRTSILLKKYNIDKKNLIIYNDYNKQKIVKRILEVVKNKQDIAFVSDNGTPMICDPGYVLVQELQKNNLEYTHIPGASAFVSALVLSGMPSDKFSFHGFLPKTKNKIKETINDLLNRNETLIFHESPHRIAKTIQILKQYNIEICIVREISKKFEEVIRKKITEIDEEKIKSIKGEMVLLIRNLEHTTDLNLKNENLNEIKDLYKTFLKYHDDKIAIEKLTKIFSLKRKQVYDIIKKN